MMHKTAMKSSTIYKNYEDRCDVSRKLEKFCLNPIITFLIAIDERVFHWLFWLEF